MNEQTETLRPFRPIKPGEILQEELEARGWTQAEFADILDRPVQAISEIITGKKSITPDTAVAFARALETSPEYWLTLESKYKLDLIDAERLAGNTIERKSRLYSLVPVKEIINRGWIRVSNLNNLREIEQAVCEFLEIPTIDSEPKISFAARRTKPEESASTAQKAWVCQAKRQAKKLQVEAYSKTKLEEVVSELIHCSLSKQKISKLPNSLAECGVRLVIVPHLPNTKIDGAAFWLDSKSPVIALSLRYDRLDGFWFTLMHEIAHILAGDGKDVTWLDNNLVGRDADSPDEKTDQELLADKNATEWLIPREKFQNFIRRTRPYYSRDAILAFAKKTRVHPAIIVGQLQYRGEVPWTHHRNLLAKIRPIFEG